MQYQVYYCPLELFDDNQIKLENPQHHKDYTYSECPVWKHRFSRTYIGYSPITFRMGIDDDILWYTVDDEEEIEVPLSEVGDYYADDVMYFSPVDVMHSHPVVQLKFPNTHFWTDFDNEYVWFEMLDHPETSLNNNFIAIGGWWNLGSHPRTTSLAVKLQDSEGDLCIEKGDPLYRIRFYSDNMNDQFKLTKRDASDNLFDSYDKRRELLTSDPKFMNQMLFDKNARKQCPFHNV